MMEDPFIAAGNEEDLEDFIKNFFPHDQKTLRTTYRLAKKKQRMLVVRRAVYEQERMQVLKVPYSLVEKKGGLRQAVKATSMPVNMLFRGLAVDPKWIFVFGEHIPKYEGTMFKEPFPKKKKREINNDHK